MSELVLTVDDQEYLGWKSVNVILSMETLSGAFNLSLSGALASNSRPVKLEPTIIPGKACTVSIDDNVIITGFIDSVSIGVSANSHTLTVSGRDKTADLIDCTAVNQNLWAGVTVDKVITDLCAPFGINVTALSDVGKKIDSYIIEQGSTIFEAIQSLAHVRQLMVLSDGLGNLILTNTKTDLSSTQLIEGVNITEGTADYDYSQRHHVYYVKGQAAATSDEDTPTVSTAFIGQAEDKAITRYRPLLILAENAADKGACQKRAEWEAALRRGKSKVFSITTTGWYTLDDLWRVNKLVTLKSDLLGVNENLLISEVNFKLDENGTLTTLKLVPPQAYSLDPIAILKKENKYMDTSES